MTGPVEDPTAAVPTAAVIADRYRLDELCGRGGTAEVWKATDTSLDRVVALKLVTVAHDESSARAADEAKTLARLSHPALVQVYDAGTDNSGRPWVVMEFVDGETLSAALKRGPLPLEEVRQIGQAVAEALDHVHAQGLVHRDVKPANILLRQGGGAKLTDFGIARLVDAAKVTSTGLLVGTASYLAPEQVAGEPVGPATDVYALGLLLLEAITGTREYDGPAVEAAMARLHRDPALPATLPAVWSSLITAMTARQPADRPSAGEVAGVLSRLYEGDATALLQQPDATTVLRRPDATTVMSTAGRSVPLVTAPAPRRNNGRIASIAAVVIALLVLVGGGIALTQHKVQPRQIPAVSNDLPTKLQNDLKNFVGQVPK
ncbi:MAG: serine/threonine protein kinase [Frankiales bacterium]|nr:serine/threonine protein kinase [Frankiales bacterium]